MTSLPSDEHPESGPDPVAVIGVAVRLPGAATPDAFWRNLRDGVESVSTFTDHDLLAAGLTREALTDPALVRARPVVADPELFDAAFFGYSPSEADTIDPQHRLFLECAWESLESAGHDPRGDEDLAVGVYAGVGPDTYFLNHLHPRQAAAGGGPLQSLLGNSGDFIASRVSYQLDLTGPSVNVQAGCSTSLVAVHLAVQSLLGGETDIALAGGSTVYCPQRAGYVHRDGGVNSPDGRCRAFDARADGTTPGDGVAVLALRRLSDAIEAGDPILGLIRGTAVNNDGGRKAGFTAPTVDVQADAAAEALAVARLDPGDIDYVEAHGTGTRMGDALEITALAEGYDGAPGGACRIGTSKPNVGDTWAAAGAVGLVKVLLAFEHEELPPSINCTEPNPEIDFASTPFRLNTALTGWKRGDRTRRAAVHTFGMGGTNAHVVLEEAPLPYAAEARARNAAGARARVTTGGGPRVADGATAVGPASDPAASTGWEVLPISARGTGALRGVAARLADHLEERPDLRLADVAHTLRIGRTPFTRRAAVLARDLAGAIAALRSLADPATDPTGRIADPTSADARTGEAPEHHRVPSHADADADADADGADARIGGTPGVGDVAGPETGPGGAPEHHLAATRALADPALDPGLDPGPAPERFGPIVAGADAQIGEMSGGVNVVGGEGGAGEASEGSAVLPEAEQVRLGRRWAEGGDVAWPVPREGTRRVALPTYPFERARHWVDPPRAAEGLAAGDPAGEPPADLAPELHPRPELDTPYTPPSTELEALVARVWGETLGIDGVGRDDGFFDLGGHSLLAARILARLRVTLPVDLDLSDLLGDPPTVAGHAARVERRLHDKLATLTDDEAAALAAELG